MEVRDTTLCRHEMGGRCDGVLTNSSQQLQCHGIVPLALGRISLRLLLVADIAFHLILQTLDYLNSLASCQPRCPEL